MKSIFLSLFLFSSFILNAQLEQCIENRFSETALFDSSEIEIDYNTQYATVEHYFTGQTLNLVMDVYYPDMVADESSSRPFILLVHGGSWFSGNKINMAYECMEYARRGFVAATIQYRLGWNCDLNNIFTACSCPNSNLQKAVYMAVQDTRAALRHIYNNAATWEIDTNWMFTGGESAGSFNSILAATWSQSEADAWLPAGFSSEVGGLDESGNELPAGFEIKAIINHCGAVPVLAHLSDNANVPIISFHDSNDCVVPYNTGQVIGCFCGGYMFVSGSSVIHTTRMNAGECSELHTVPASFAHCTFPKASLVKLASCFLKRTMCGVCTSFSNTDIYTAAMCSPLSSPCPPPNTCPADFTGDGVVNISDLLIFMAQFGNVCE